MGHRGRSRTHRCSAFVQQSRIKSCHHGSARNSRRGICRFGRVRDLSRKHHAQFSHGHTCAFKGTGRKCQEYRVRIVSWTGKSAREKRRRCAHDHQSAAITRNVFPMPPGSARTVSTAPSSSSARRQNELRRLPQSTRRHGRKRRRNQCATVA
jgi:hypothetical protein